MPETADGIVAAMLPAVADSPAIVGLSCRREQAQAAPDADRRPTPDPESTGTATCPEPFNTTGPRSITASYSGDQNFTASTGSLTETVGQAVTTTTVTPRPTRRRSGRR